MADDILKDAEKAAKHAANQVANGVRDAFAVVGNATGLTDVIESNTETFTNVGRGYACMATFCYSEELRKKQLEEAEAEAKREYDRYVAEKVQEYESSSKQERREAAWNAWKLAENRRNILNERYKLAQTEVEVLRAFMLGVSKESEFRKKLVENNITGRPLKNREMIPAADEFVKTYKQDYRGALKKLNEAIASLNQTTQRSHAQLMAEFLRIVEQNTLTEMVNAVTAQIGILQMEFQNLQLSAVEAATDAEVARLTYEQEQF
ncbi:hypothetical protein EZJ49_09880 [Bdellovibrio bacteriovorus]|uniref:hypothetical protein n=1 Tax=Bdellovibrio bacteriovorus TaxID=959 RepID=UPI0021D1F8E2|nr:hypothetical protein [Bdellovibrio bacteriovorus]UXR63383.1 hypothetical protein EZJ49_09880 [Bdellovibrio bacteriovorus]